MREADRPGAVKGLTDDELAFYDALETNDGAVKVLGDETPCGMAREFVASVSAQLRVIVNRILRKHDYPPDKQEKATQTVLEQSEVLSQEWAVAWTRDLLSAPEK